MILLGLGANLPSQAGPPRSTLLAALDFLARNGIRISAVSPFYASPAWPDPTDPEFVNAVAAIETDLTPGALLALLHLTEAAFGRQRATPNAPRTLDLDILDYDGRIETGPPQLPHPRLSRRAFVIVPMADVAPDWIHPVSGRNVAEMIADLGGGERDVKALD